MGIVGIGIPERLIPLCASRGLSLERGAGVAPAGRGVEAARCSRGLGVSLLAAPIERGRPVCECMC